MGIEPPFSLVPGGPFHALTRRVGLARGDAWDVARLSLVFGVVPWLVLVVLAFFESSASGSWPVLTQMPSVHVRLLVAIPAFFLAERSLHVRTRRCIERIEAFVDPSDERLPRCVGRTVLLRDSIWMELFLLALVAVYAALTWTGVGSLHLSVGQSQKLEPTATVVWYGLLALPVFQFLCLRWTWHWVLWTLLLARISVLRLRPIPSHPDRRGGLGFLAEPQVGFAYVLLGLSAVMAAGTAPGFEVQALDTAAFGLRLIGLVLVALLVAFGPLLLFAPVLFRARFAGLRAYDSLAADYTSRFQHRWFEGAGREELLGTPDLQSLADLANSCDVVRQMRIVPFTRYSLLLVAAAVCAPYLVLLLTEIPLPELLQELANSVLGQRLL